MGAKRTWSAVLATAVSLVLVAGMLPAAAFAEVRAAALEGAGISPAYRVNDPYASVAADMRNSINQWWLASLDMPAAWDIARTDGDVTVAVVDTGINFQHPDLAANIDYEHAYDAVADAKLEKSPDSEKMAHGSHVAGIVAATANNAEGIAGVSFNARILPINVFQTYSGSTFCDDEDLIRAYSYLLSDPDGDGRTIAQETNTRVVNMSLGGYNETDPMLEKLIEKAADAGIVTVCAGGNGDDQGLPITKKSYPSDYDACISVVALDSADERAPWADYNQFKDLSAPGVDIWSTWYRDDEYHIDSGTSMASPMVAGIAALVLSYHPELTVDQLKDALYSTADDLGAEGFDELYGWGKVNPAAALAQLGDVAVTAERAEMVRTSSQQLGVILSKKAKASGTWKWESDDPSVARVDDSGVVRAVAPGKTVVRAIDAANTTIAGKREISVADIAVPGKVVARGSRFEWGIDVEWPAAECAVAYDVQRAAGAGKFAVVGRVAAPGAATSGDAAGGTVSFADADVEAGVDYRYRVVPVGELDGQEVVGAVSGEATGFYTDKVALGRQITAAQELRASTVPSADGKDVLSGQMWAPLAAFSAFDAALAKATKVSYLSSVTQDRVNAAAAELADAAAAFGAERKAGLKLLPAFDVSKATVTLAKGPVYTGKAVKAVQKVTLAGKVLRAGSDYTVAYKDNVNAGKATATVKGMGAYGGALVKTFTIARAANPFKLGANTVTTTAAKAKKGKVVLAGAKLTGNKGGAVTYSAPAHRWFSVNAKTGKVTVKAGAPKGAYKLTVKATAAAKGNYAKTAKSAQVTVRVK